MDTKTWLDGAWMTVPQQIYNFFNYMTYQVGTLMKVLDPKAFFDVAYCCL